LSNCVRPLILLVVVAFLGVPASTYAKPGTSFSSRVAEKLCNATALVKRAPQFAQNKWQQHQALNAIEKAIHGDPALEKEFLDHYAEIGGRKIVSTKDAYVMLAIGSLVNIGGYLQPDVLMPYLLAGAAIDATTFSTRVYSVKKMKRQTILSMMQQGMLPVTLTTQYQDLLAPLSKKYAKPFPPSSAAHGP
jgi:hypothetical protein